MSLFGYNEAYQDEDILNLQNPKHLQEIIKILLKHSDKRSRRELRNLHNILKVVPFFQKAYSQMPEDVYANLLRELKHKYIKKAQHVFHEKDQEHSFYVILKGSIFFLLPPNNEHKQIPAGGTELTTLGPISSIRSVSDMNSHVNLTPEFVATIGRENENRLTLDEALSTHANHKLMKIRKETDSFCQKSLDYQPYSTVTAQCREGCSLLTLSSAAYTKILRQNQRKMHRDNIEFLKTVPLTSEWSQDSLFSLTYYLKPQTLRRNQTIFDIGDPIECIYLIRSGEVEITQEANVNLTGEEFFSKTTKITNPSDLDKTKLFDMNAIWKNRFSQAKKHNIKLAILSDRQSFGEEDVFTNATKRKSKAVAKSHTVELFAISAHNFLECGKNHVQHDESPKSLGAKKKWRQELEHQVLDMAHQNEVKAQNLKSTKQLVEPVFIPVLFAKKGDKLGAKHVRSTSSANTSHFEVQVVPHFNLHQYPEGVIDLSSRRQLKTPNTGRIGSPKSRKNSPGEPVTERYPLFEAATTPRVRLLSSHQSRVSISHMKTPKAQNDARKSIKPNSIEASPTSSIKTPFARSSFLNFVNGIDSNHKSPRNNPLDIIGRVSFKEINEIRRNELSSAGTSPKAIRCWEDDRIHEPNVAKDELYHKMRNNSIYSSRGSRLELNKIAVPLSVFTPQTSRPRTSVKPKHEITTFATTFATPRASMNSKGVADFTQAINGIAPPIALTGTKVYSSRPSFKGAVIKKTARKSHI